MSGLIELLGDLAVLTGSHVSISSDPDGPFWYQGPYQSPSQQRSGPFTETKLIERLELDRHNAAKKVQRKSAASERGLAYNPEPF